MVPSAWLPSLALLTLTLPVVKGQRNTCAADAEGSQGARCIKGQGRAYASAFCSSFLPITTPVRTSTATVTNTVTRNLTSFIDTVTETFSPPATTTSSETAIFSSTVTETRFDTVVTGTITSFIATTEETTTSYSNVYTCPGDSISSSSPAITSSSSSRNATLTTPSFPTTSKNVTISPSGPTGATGTGTIGTAISSSIAYNSSLPYYTWTRSSQTPSSSGLTPPYYTSANATTSSLPPGITPPAYSLYDVPAIKKRQVFGRPRCLRRLDRVSGLVGISDACNCLEIVTPTATDTTETIFDPSVTITATNTVSATFTATTTPTITVTQPINRTSIVTDFVTSTTQISTTVPATLTIIRTSVSVIVGPSPTPSEFNLYYRTNSTQGATFFQAGPAPGGSGIVLANDQREADFFSIDGMNRLTDVTAGNLLLAKNTQDLYPFALLQTAANSDNTAVCDACGGRLKCDYPGTEGNVFALCYGFLALGPPEVFGQDADSNGGVDCRVIDLLST